MLQLSNESGRPRKLSATGYVEWVLGDLRAKSAAHIVTEVAPDSAALYARNPYSNDYADWMHRRLDVKPGMTGLWQVSGRSRLGLLDMYRLDVTYAEQACLVLDVKLLLRTIPVVLGRDGAA